MDFLFIHGNYPAQFRHLAASLAQSSNNRVIFLTAREDASEEPLPGVKIRTFACHRSPSPDTHHYVHATEEAVLQGQAVLREISKVVEDGFFPKVVISHGGMGLGLFIKDLLPETLHIGYFEWFFKPETSQYLLEDFNLDTQLKVGLRNLPIIQELERCDLAVVPTNWQKQQFPNAFQNKLRVIFDGIDESFFQRYSSDRDFSSLDLQLQNRESNENVVLKAGSRVLSYATRGMETLRGFPEFLRALPSMLETFPDLEVVIAGKDRRAYSFDAPSHDGSWKYHVMSQLGAFKGRERIHFVGLLNYPDYRNLLWRSTLHCYFTRPYVTSWSLFEAASCGAKLAVSKGPATEGILAADSAIWVDLENQQDINKKLLLGIEKTTKPAKILPGFDLTTSMRKWEKLLNDGLQSS